MKKRSRRKKLWSFFLLDILKTTFLIMRNLIQKWILSDPFFQNQDTYFDFQKRVGEASPPLSPHSCTPDVISHVTCSLQFQEFCQPLLVSSTDSLNPLNVSVALI